MKTKLAVAQRSKRTVHVDQFFREFSRAKILKMMKTKQDVHKRNFCHRNFLQALILKFTTWQINNDSLRDLKKNASIKSAA